MWAVNVLRFQKKREAQKTKAKVQLKEFDLDAYLEGQSRRQSVFGSISVSFTSLLSIACRFSSTRTPSSPRRRRTRCRR